MIPFRIKHDNPDVRKLRKGMDDLGMGQVEFGEALGIPQPSISRLLSGLQQIHIYHLLAVECLLLKQQRSI